MKKIILALTALTVAVSPLARAQVSEPSAVPEATPPEKSEPSPSPADDPSVSVTTEKSASPAASSSPASSTKTSPSPAAKSASSAPAKAASSAALAPIKKSTPEATLREIENRWEASIMARDPSFAQAYLADDYRGVTSKGKVVNKAGLISQIKKDTDTYTSAKNGRMDVRVYGGRFAVVTGTSTEIGKEKDGKAFNRTYRWTDTWIDRNGKWQCVASQAMQVK